MKNALAAVVTRAVRNRDVRRPEIAARTSLNPGTLRLDGAGSQLIGGVVQAVEMQSSVRSIQIKVPRLVPSPDGSELTGEVNDHDDR